MPDLAWDKNARRFVVPPNATAWRVSKKNANGRGKPEQRFTHAGPLHLELHASFEALAIAVNHEPGWYILHLVDENGLIIPNVPAAHVQVVPKQEPGGHKSAQDELLGPTMAAAVHRLASTVEHFATCSVQREEALTQALVAMTEKAFTGMQGIQEGTAQLMRSAQAGYDIASGASLPKVPELPAPPPMQEKEKTFMDFLCSESGKTAFQMASSMFKAAVDK